MSRTFVQARPRQGLMLGFSGFPAHVIVPAAARLAKIIRASAG
jgi:GntR family transcriptional regulator/MocR family aminotransferase